MTPQIRSVYDVYQRSEWLLMDYHEGIKSLNQSINEPSRSCNLEPAQTCLCVTNTNHIPCIFIPCIFIPCISHSMLRSSWKMFDCCFVGHHITNIRSFINLYLINQKKMCPLKHTQPIRTLASTKTTQLFYIIQNTNLLQQ